MMEPENNAQVNGDKQPPLKKKIKLKTSAVKKIVGGAKIVGVGHTGGNHNECFV